MGLGVLPGPHTSVACCQSMRAQWDGDCPNPARPVAGSRLRLITEVDERLYPIRCPYPLGVEVQKFVKR